MNLRLPLELFKLLEGEGKKRKKRPASYARTLLIEALTGSSSPVEQKLSELQASIDRLGRELATKRRASAATSAVAPGTPTEEGRTTLRDWVTAPPGEE